MISRSDRRVATRHVVTAVLVSHDGAQWLRHSLPALLGQSRLPDRVVAVDTGSLDDSVDLLTAHLGASSVVSANRRTGFGAAIAAGLASLAGGPAPAPDPAVTTGTAGPTGTAGSAAAEADTDATTTVEWLWLLHDDCAPAPDALEALCAFVEDNPSAAVVGPKVHDWYDERRLLEVGVTTDGAGHRHTGIERREVDQGQHDDVGDVLAVGSAGALVRRDVWERLGGYDPALPLFGDDIDFGWRATLAGERVLVASAAVVRHAEASARGRRRMPAVSGSPHRVTRRHGLYTVTVNASLPAAVFAGPRLALGTLIRVIAYLLTRRPRLAWDELAGYLALLAGLPRVIAGRRRRSRPAVSRRAVRPLLARPGARLRAFVEALTDHRGGDEPEDRPARDPGLPIETGPVAEDAEVLAQPRLSWRRVLLRPGLLLFVGLVVVALVAERRLLHGGALLAGGHLLPPLGGASDLWRLYTTSWHDVGIGSTTPTPPLVAVVAVLASVLFGKVWLAVDVLLLGCVPLAGAAAYAALRRWRVGTPVRCWAAATYALLPLGTGVVSQGRVGDALAFVVLPLTVGAAAGALADAGRRGSWRRWWVSGLWLTVAVAAAPPLWPPAAAALGVLVLAGVAALATGKGRGGRAAGLRIALGPAIVAGVPVGVLLPWSVQLWRNPTALVLGLGAQPSLHPGQAGAASPAPWRLLLLHPGGPGLPIVWLAVPLLVAAFAGLLRRDRAHVALAGVAAAAAAVGVGILQARALATPTVGGAAVLGWAGPATALAGAGLVAAAVAGAAQARTVLARMSFGWRQPVAGVLAAMVAALPLALAGAWLVRGTPGPVAVTTPSSILPAFVSEDLASSPGTRALVLDRHADGSVGFLVVGDRRPWFGSEDLARRADGVAHIAAVAHALLGSPGPAAAELPTLGVRYVVVAGVRPDELGDRLDSQPTLARSSADASVSVWRSTLPVSGLALLPPQVAGRARTAATPDPAHYAGVRLLPLNEGDTEAQLPPGGAGRLLALATPFDTHWRAVVAGRALRPTHAWGWAQAFEVPASASSSRLVLQHVDPARDDALRWALGILVLSLIFAAPSVRRDEEPAAPDGSAPDSPVAELVTAGGSAIPGGAA